MPCAALWHLCASHEGAEAWSNRQHRQRFRDVPAFVSFVRGVRRLEGWLLLPSSSRMLNTLCMLPRKFTPPILLFLHVSFLIDGGSSRREVQIHVIRNPAWSLGSEGRLSHSQVPGGVVRALTPLNFAVLSCGCAMHHTGTSIAMSGLGVGSYCVLSAVCMLPRRLAPPMPFVSHP